MHECISSFVDFFEADLLPSFFGFFVGVALTIVAFRFDPEGR